MREIVRQSFAAFSEPMEGKVECMYRDHLGKVTTGIGNLIDSAAAAWEVTHHGATWVHKSDHSVAATQAEVTAEWHRVKGDTSLIGDVGKARRTATLILTEASITNLVASKALQFERTLKTHHAFAGFDDWPADAQLAVLSMAWAMGAGFGPDWPDFSGAVAGSRPNWFEAVHHCNMVNSWMLKRNAVNRGLFRNAAWATETGASFDVLWIAIPGNQPVLKLTDPFMTDATHAGQGFDSDDAVSVMQGFLGYLGFFTGSTTGVFDHATNDAVKGFQLFESTLRNNEAFAVDGIVGQTSWAALGYVVPRS